MKVICAIVLALVAVVATDVAPAYGDFAHGYGVAHPGYGFPGYGGFGFGYGFGVNDEHHYRAHPGYPVHVGNGNFYYLGIYPGQCANTYAYSFYAAQDTDSFIVCDHGRAHRFQCPYGTKNSGTSHLAYNTAYSMSVLCGEHTH